MREALSAAEAERARLEGERASAAAEVAELAQALAEAKAQGTPKVGACHGEGWCMASARCSMPSALALC